MNSGPLGKVGEITEAVITALNLPITPGTPIYIGQSNIEHMLNKHAGDDVKYGCYIHDIVGSPDYVGINPGDGSIEYVKDFPVDGDYVKVAVRIANSGTYFARSIYALNPGRVQNFITSGTLKPLTVDCE
jgi:hypothetical protein